MVTPYYQDDHVTIYHGDCRDLITSLTYDVVVTDPPYGLGWNISAYNGGASHVGIHCDENIHARDDILNSIGDRPALCFAAPMGAPYHRTRQVLVWSKGADAGIFGSVAGWRRDWEAIYVIGKWDNQPACRSSILATNEGLATRTRDLLGGYASGRHPHGKPLSLMRTLVELCPPGVILDPFMGSGTTLRAAKDLGRKAIGIEIDEAYCELAVKRLAQESLAF